MKKENINFHIVKEGINNIKDKNELLEMREVLFNFKESTSKNLDFNSGLFYGLVLGILASLFITLFYSLEISKLSVNLQEWIMIALAFLILFFIVITIKEHKKFNLANEELNILLDMIDEKISISSHKI